MAKLKRFARIVIALLIFGGLALPLSAHAATSGSINAVAVGYGSNGQLQNGMIVGLQSANAKKVIALTAANITNMYGVVVPATSAPVTLSESNTSGQVYVATIGNYDVLVSNQNGPIKVGDYITISSLTGIGMKADSSDALVIGKAAANFNGNTDVEGTSNLKSTTGQNVTVSISSIPVDIDVNHNPLIGSITGVPGFLKGAANLVTNQQVSTVRLYFAFGILIIAALISGSVLYGGARSGVTAVGRNPLAKSRIMSSLLRVIFSSVVIFIIGIGAVYLVLKV